MAEAQSQREGSSARGRSGKAAVGSECPGDGRIPGCGHPVVGKCRLDNKFGKRVSSATARRDGRSATHASQGAEPGSVKDPEQQKVETETVEGGQEAIVIEPANPQFVYVPSYDPAVVYGPPGDYPYPAYYYPGYVPGMGLAFGTGLILGAAWANNWGNCNWGHGDITINNNNNFNRNNVNNINRGQQGGKWQHSAQHRGGAPYGDRNTANKYGGRARQQPAGGTNRPGGAAGLAGGAAAVAG